MARLAGDDHCYDVSDWHFDNVGVMGHLGAPMKVVLVDWQGHAPATTKTGRQRMKGAIAGKNSLTGELQGGRFFDTGPCGAQWRVEMRRVGETVAAWWLSCQWAPTSADIARLKVALPDGSLGDGVGESLAPWSSASAPSEASAETRLGVLADVSGRPAGTHPVADAMLPTTPPAPLSEESAKRQRSARA